jgi:hypothetical protein
MSREKGRHDRKGRESVILAKKLEHERLEKFCAMLPSKGCGKGVGRVGGVLGIVGTV